MQSYESKTLISIKQDSIREKVWRRPLLQKSDFKITEKKKFSRCFHKPTTYWKWTPPGNFHKISAENHYDCRQIGSKQIPASVAVLKHCISHEISQCGTKLLLKSTSKWDYIKKDNQMTFIFKISKTYQRTLKRLWFFVFQKDIERSTMKLWQFFIHWSYMENVH